MRISGVVIENFKGLRRATFSDLREEPVVILSGRNGTGKSLVLNAMATLWNEQYNPALQVGPYADECHLEMSIHLTGAELEAVNDWSHRVHGTVQKPAESYLVSVTFSKLTGGFSGPREPLHPVLSILRNITFQQEYPFARLDYLPAVRSLVSSVTPAVNLGMFRPENMLQERREFIQQTLVQEIPTVSLPDIASYLATLDYQTFLSSRQGLDLPDEYGLITKAFSDATAKHILRPVMNRDSGESGIYVQVSEAVAHPIDKLSSGEKSLLGLMYFVRRVSASGGVLLLDEPEQHLHPTLQAALFEAMKELADRAQVFVVSHSPNLISTVPASALLEVRPANEAAGNQVIRLNEQPEKMDLLAALGLTPAQVLQTDGLLVVEGKTDRKVLQALFPVEMGRVHTLVAGDSNQVLSTYRTLSELSLGIPWLCLRDRDLLTGDERSRLLDSYENLHIWEIRAIESHLLSPDLVGAVMAMLGKEAPLDELERMMRTISEPLQEEVLAGLVEAELTRRFPPPGASPQGSRFAKIKWQYEQYAEINRERAEALNDVEEEQRRALAAIWDAEWRMLVDPKVALARLNAELRLFKSAEDMKSALLVRARDDLSVRPAGLEALRARLVAKLDGSG
ncbi:AAA family ATPase [Streptomyces sp. B21-097]|uniref:ATP-dependent nuclease n=1 Tax=Streptomyces sp. B21-097 TaxID=3039414 RepID=UPI002FF1ED90